MPICDEVSAVLFEAQAREGCAGLAPGAGAASRGGVRRAVPELRRDPVVGRWVIISTERSRRPSDFASAPVRPQSAGPCVFCPGQESRTPEEILAVRGPGSPPNGPGWQVRVVPNKFPALRIEGELEPAGDGVYDRMNGIGAHEVIIETPDHAPRWRTCLETQVVRGARGVAPAHGRPPEGHALRVRQRLQEPRGGRRRVAGAPALPAHRDAHRAHDGRAGARRGAASLPHEEALHLVRRDPAGDAGEDPRGRPAHPRGGRARGALSLCSPLPLRDLDPARGASARATRTRTASIPARWLTCSGRS